MAAKKPVEVILGTHTIGDPALMPGVIHFDTQGEVQDLLDTFYNRGYRHIDTASNYPGSEARLGSAGATSRFVVHTKVRDGQPRSHEPAKIEQSLKQSLEDLKTTSVETFFLHVPDRQTPLREVLEAINDAHQQAKFKRFGLSNYTAAEVEMIINICEQRGYTKPSVYQGQYNLIVRGGEKELFPLLRKHNMAFFAYSPAAAGFFSAGDNNATSKRWSKDNFIGKTYSSIYGHPDVQALVTTVKNAADKHGISGHAAALRWTAFHGVLDGDRGDGVIFGVSKMEQLHKTLDALEAGPLPAELADAMTAIYAKVEGNEPRYHL